MFHINGKSLRIAHCIFSRYITKPQQSQVLHIHSSRHHLTNNKITEEKTPLGRFSEEGRSKEKTGDVKKKS